MYEIEKKKSRNFKVEIKNFQNLANNWSDESGLGYIKLNQISFWKVTCESEQMGKTLRGDRTHLNTPFLPYEARAYLKWQAIRWRCRTNI